MLRYKVGVAIDNMAWRTHIEAFKRRAGLSYSQWINSLGLLIILTVSYTAKKLSFFEGMNPYNTTYYMLLYGTQ